MGLFHPYFYFPNWFFGPTLYETIFPLYSETVLGADISPGFFSKPVFEQHENFHDAWGVLPFLTSICFAQVIFVLFLMMNFSKLPFGSDVLEQSFFFSKYQRSNISG